VDRQCGRRRRRQMYASLEKSSTIHALVSLQYYTCTELCGRLKEEWLGRRDSNPDTQLQRLQSYR
jgi:hypothetical protein